MLIYSVSAKHPPSLAYRRHIKMIADSLNKPHPPLDMEKTH
jgi:hypothetical protein